MRLEIHFKEVHFAALKKIFPKNENFTYTYCYKEIRREYMYTDLVLQLYVLFC